MPPNPASLGSRLRDFVLGEAPPGKVVEVAALARDQEAGRHHRGPLARPRALTVAVHVTRALGPVRIRLQIEDVAHAGRELLAGRAPHVTREWRDRHADQRRVEPHPGPVVVVGARRRDQLLDLIAELPANRGQQPLLADGRAPVDIPVLEAHHHRGELVSRHGADRRAPRIGVATMRSYLEGKYGI